METSALDSTNVEAAFNEVLSGRCLQPRVPPHPGGLFDSPADSHDLQPSKRRWPANRWPAAPSAPWPCPAPSEALTPRRVRGAAARAPNRPLPWYGSVTSKDGSHMVSSRNYFTGKKSQFWPYRYTECTLYWELMFRLSPPGMQSSRDSWPARHTPLCPLSFLKSSSAW